MVLELVDTLPGNRYGLTTLGEELTAGRLRDVARMFGSEPTWSAWGGLEHAVRTGEPGFDHAHGADTWEYYASHPDDSERFDAAMAALTRGSAEAIVDAYDFARFRRVVDVGGGDGTLLAAILNIRRGLLRPKWILHGPRRCRARCLCKGTRRPDHDAGLGIVGRASSTRQAGTPVTGPFDRQSLV